MVPVVELVPQDVLYLRRHKAPKTANDADKLQLRDGERMAFAGVGSLVTAATIVSQA